MKPTLCLFVFAMCYCQAQDTPIVNSPDDREDSIPTAWAVISHQTENDIAAAQSAGYVRAIDIQVEQTVSPIKYTVTYVRNSGAYYKRWWFYRAGDFTTLYNAVQQNNARLTVVKPFDAGNGRILYPALGIENRGRDYKVWSWLPGSASVSIPNGLRPVQVHSYTAGGQVLYAVIMNDNTGRDGKLWWWYSGVSADDLGQFAGSNHARIIDIDYTPASGAYNGIMESCGAGCPAWGFYNDQTSSSLQSRTSVSASLDGLVTESVSRPIAVNTYPGCGDLCYSFVLLDNSLPALDPSNAITKRVGQLLRANGVTGVQGLYLKQVGGPVLAELLESFVFEPASTIKVLSHLFAVRQAQNGGSVPLDGSVVHYTNEPDSCPDPAAAGGTEPLRTALTEMMWHSDNARAREVNDTFGYANINALALSIGMPDTQLNQILGCGGGSTSLFPNPQQTELTLHDAGVLLEGVASGKLLTPFYRSAFFDMMAGKAEYQHEGYDFTTLWMTDIPAMLTQEAPAGATPDQLNAFKDQMNLAYKAGSYSGSDGPSATALTEWLSIAGWAQIPFCSGGSILPRQFVFGTYLHAANDSSYFSGKITAADLNFGAAKTELLREQIRAGLASCLPARYSMSSTQAQTSPAGSAGSVTLTVTPSFMPWTASSNQNWLKITAGASGTGSGTIGYSVDPNTGAPRTGTLLIAGQPFTVTQGAGAACAFSLAPTDASLGNGSGMTGASLTGSFTLTASHCTAADTWTAVSDSTRLRIVSAVTGNGAAASVTVAYSMLTNSTTVPRTAHISVAGRTFTVTQTGSSESQSQRVVRALYQTILGREPDLGGWTFWTGPGAPKDPVTGAVMFHQMADDFYRSTEFGNTGWAVLSIGQTIQGTFPSFASWLSTVTEVRNGSLTLVQLTNNLAGSASNPAFVTSAFQNGFGRLPTASELNANVGNLNAGQSRFDFLNNVILANSAAGFLNRSNPQFVQALYYTILVRDPDAGGFNFWLGQLTNSPGQPGIYASSLTTSAYAAKLAVIGQAVPPNPSLLGFLGSPEFQGLIQ